jgi:hypothetical protein
VASALVALAVVAGPAFAIERGLVPWFRGEPAPPPITEALARFSTDFARTRPFAPDSPLAHLRPEEARGLIAFESPAGPVQMWGVPIETGDRCTYTEAAGRGRGLFCGRPTADSPLSVGYGPLGRKGYVLVEGRAHADVVWVGVRLADGSVEAVPLVDGYFVTVLDQNAAPAQLLARRRDDSETAVSLRLDRPAGER